MGLHNARLLTYITTIPKSDIMPSMLRTVANDTLLLMAGEQATLIVSKIAYARKYDRAVILVKIANIPFCWG